MRLVVQVPCLNEEETLPGTLADLPREVPGFESVEWLGVRARRRQIERTVAAVKDAEVPAGRAVPQALPIPDATDVARRRAPITEGAVAGEPMVFGSLLLPTELIIKTPEVATLSNASASTSSSSRGAATPLEILALITSIPSFGASSALQRPFHAETQSNGENGTTP